MKIIIFSDLHLEFGTDFMPPKDSEADLMILAGDICLFNDMSPMERFLDGWTKPVLYIAGNHEYYGAGPMGKARQGTVEWLAESNPNVKFLHDEAVEIGGVQFFGGTMWTWFDQRDQEAMTSAQWTMNDYRLITDVMAYPLTPERTVEMHEAFIAKLLAWLDNGIALPRAVITHHVPIMNPKTKYKKSVLVPAYVSLDAHEIIKRFQPDFWCFGHCLSEDTEILTLNGWRGRYNINKDDGVYSYNKTTGLLEKDTIKHIMTMDGYFGKVFDLNSRKISFCVTEDHNMVFFPSGSQNLITEPMRLIFNRSGCDFIKSGLLPQEGMGLPSRMLELYIAIAADGSLSNKDFIRFRFNKERKINYVKNLLQYLNVKYKEMPANKSGAVSINFTLPSALSGLKIKGLDKNILKCNQQDCEEILEAYKNTDGGVVFNQVVIYTSKTEEVDILQHIFTINGYLTKTDTRLHGFSINSKEKKKSHTIYVKKGFKSTVQRYRLNKILKEYISSGQNFWCIENKNHNFFIRRNGKIMLIGNSHECDRQKIGKTLVLSNQRGYPRPRDLCEGFDPAGAPIEL